MDDGFAVDFSKAGIGLDVGGVSAKSHGAAFLLDVELVFD